MKKYQLLFIGLLLISVFAGPSSRNVSAEVSQKEINEAIKKGMKFLIKKRVKGREAELLALTYAHLGLTEKHPKIREAVKYLLKSRLQETYNVSVAAMALEAINRQKYQLRATGKEPCGRSAESRLRSPFYRYRSGRRKGMPSKGKIRVSPFRIGAVSRIAEQC